MIPAVHGWWDFLNTASRDGWAGERQSVIIFTADRRAEIRAAFQESVLYKPIEVGLLLDAVCAELSDPSTPARGDFSSRGGLNWSVRV
jgi:hypothetical protein